MKPETLLEAVKRWQAILGILPEFLKNPDSLANDLAKTFPEDNPTINKEEFKPTLFKGGLTITSSLTSLSKQTIITP